MGDCLFNDMQFNKETKVSSSSGKAKSYDVAHLKRITNLLHAKGH